MSSAGWCADGATLLLTTQYLEEADELASTIVVVDHGKVIARGTADELKSQVGGQQLEVIAHDAAEIPHVIQLLAGVADGTPEVDHNTRKVTAPVSGGVAALSSVANALVDAGIALDDIGLRRPTLDDVFLRLTGHAAEVAMPDTKEPASTTRSSSGKAA